MIHSFPTLLVHTTPINHDKMFSQVVNGQKFSNMAAEEKKATLGGTLDF